MPGATASWRSAVESGRSSGRSALGVGTSGDAESLPGGEGRSWRVGDLVLKPEVDAEEWKWLGEAHALRRRGRSPRGSPVRASEGSWTVAGWGAAAFLDGAHAERWLD